jgi:ferric-dicitrate binding protein FerR (iron transport regulator)
MPQAAPICVVRFLVDLLTPPTGALLMSFKKTRSLRRPRSTRRATHRGYALLFVILIAAIGGFAVMGIAHTVRFETLEVEAKRKELTDRHTVILNAEKGKARAPAK